MEQQTVEVKFQGEQVGSYDAGSASYTLYRVPGAAYVIHVVQGDESWLETMGGNGLTDGQVKTYFPRLAAAVGLD